MAKDTKETVAKAFLVLASKEETITLVKLSEISGVMRPTIRANFGKDPIAGIADYLYSKIDKEIQERLLLHDIEELTAEIFANILLPVLYENRDIFRILLTSPHLSFRYDFIQLEQRNQVYFEWAREHFERVAKELSLGPSITGNDLLAYFIRWLNSVWSLWLNSEIPDEPAIFKKKFLLLMKFPMSAMINDDVKKENM